MSSRILLTFLACLVLSWANGVNPIEAQFVRKPLATQKQIEDRLRQPISLNFKDVPLNQAVKDLSLLSGVPVMLDQPFLDDWRINSDTPVSICVDNIDMKSALNLMLNHLRLRFVIENNAIVITVPERKARLRRVTYPVSGLVVPAAAIEGQRVSKTNEDALIRLITSTVAKHTWECNGGAGTIEYFPFGKALVVNQPQEIQEEVQLLLAMLRRLQDLQVSAELRFVQTSPETAKRWRKDMEQHGKGVESDETLSTKPRPHFHQEPLNVIIHSTKRPFVAMESAQHVKQLLEIAQADRTAAIIQAPKVTVFNGQRVPLECVQKKALVAEFRGPAPHPELEAVLQLAADWGPAKKTQIEPVTVVSKQDNIVGGWRCELLPVVSPDRRHVRLTVNLEHMVKDEANAVEHITKAAKTFVLHDASTLVWDLGATGQQHLFVLITPRVHVQPEEERILQGEIPPFPGR